ncbi:MAG: 50S ribosomal protein L6 [Candidatus Wildermuthbacteria bacterium]|nr:50S ribosomal protein L6 [Candidatus Wildermuthbacteria bacterium]
MSRIGKKPIEIPSGVDVAIDGQTVTAKGPKGALSRAVHAFCRAAKEGNTIVVKPADASNQEPSKSVKSLWGLTRTLIANMIQGVDKGYEKRLEIEGIGFKAALEGKTLTLNVGFSHAVKVEPLEGVNFAVEKNTIIVSGIDKEKVGECAARVRALKPTEPYKGKGIKYQGEFVRRKLGKRAATAAK